MPMTGNKVDSGRYVITVGHHKDVPSPEYSLLILAVAGLVLCLYLGFSLKDSFSSLKLFIIIAIPVPVFIALKAYYRTWRRYDNAKFIADKFIIDTNKGILILPEIEGGGCIKLSDILKVKERVERVKYKVNKQTKYKEYYYLDIVSDSYGAETFRFNKKYHMNEVYALLYSSIKYGIK